MNATCDIETLGNHVRVSSPGRSTTTNLRPLSHRSLERLPWEVFQEYITFSCKENLSYHFPLLIFIVYDTSLLIYPSRSDAVADPIPISQINGHNTLSLQYYPDLERQWHIASQLTGTVLSRPEVKDQDVVSSSAAIIKSYDTPLQDEHIAFIRLAVSLLSNAHVDPQVDDMLVRLCLNSRNLAPLKRLLGQDLPSVQAFSERLLFSAVTSCNIALVKFLIISGVDPFAIRSDGTGWDSGLTKAVRTGDSGVVRAVLNVTEYSHPRDRKTTSFKKRAHWSAKGALYLAVSQNNVEVLQALYDGLPPSIFRTAALMEAQSIISTASSNGLSEIVTFILSHIQHTDEFCKRAHCIALSGAVEGGQLHLAQYLVNHGVDVNSTTRQTVKSGLRKFMYGPKYSDESSVLCIAAITGHTNMVKFLIERGADPNLRYLGPHPLGIAIHQGFNDIVRILLEAGANPNKQLYRADRKGTLRLMLPLELAAEIGSSAIFFLLVDHGAKMDPTNPVLHRVLRSALVGRSRDIFDFVLDSHPWSITAAGEESFHVAIKFLDRDIIQRFLKSGARPCNPQVLLLGTLRGDMELVQYLVYEIEAHCGDLPTSFGVMGMVLAARLGDLGLLRFFLHRGVNPYDTITEEDQTHQCRGCGEQTSCASSLLAEEQPSPGSSALSEILIPRGSGEPNRVKCCKFLLDNCTKRSSSFHWTKAYLYQKALSIALSKAIEYGYVDLIDTIYISTASYCTKYDYHTSPLAAAAKIRSISLVEKMLLDNSKRETPDDDFEEALDDALALAIDHGITRREEETSYLSTTTLTIVRLLLLKGANPNSHRLNGSLYKAVELGDVELIKLLLAHDARAHGVGWPRQNPIHLASRQGNIEVLKVLLGAGDDQRQRQSIPHTATALLFAADRGRLDAVLHLLKILTDAYGQYLNRHYRRAIYGAWQSGHDALARTICSFLEERFEQSSDWNVEKIIRHVLNESGDRISDIGGSAKDNAGEMAARTVSEVISPEDEETDSDW